MSKTLKTIIVIIVIALIIIIPITSSYNSIATLDQKVSSSSSNIDTQLQRRSDLIPNLVSTVKGYASQEKDIFTSIANARAKLGGAQGIQEKAQADSELSQSLSRLLVIVENYPDLKSNQNFRDLSVALEGSENRISVARQDYNNAVNNYNTSIVKFPTNIIARIFGFNSKPYYRADQGAKQVPKVDFTK
ncbi:LemA family protein [Clostridium arbusti]|uniref:LemA family protein n=1 Tax=Clostridium arbusti TaxID=1137848 RepID=UPI0002894FEC|nr:LemA family protein [Clostridium arbusti]